MIRAPLYYTRTNMRFVPNHYNMCQNCDYTLNKNPTEVILSIFDNHSLPIEIEDYGDSRSDGFLITHNSLCKFINTVKNNYLFSGILGKDKYNVKFVVPEYFLNYLVEYTNPAQAIIDSKYFKRTKGDLVFCFGGSDFYVGDHVEKDECWVYVFRESTLYKHIDAPPPTSFPIRIEYQCTNQT